MVLSGPPPAAYNLPLNSASAKKHRKETLQVKLKHLKKAKNLMVMKQKLRNQKPRKPPTFLPVQNRYRTILEVMLQIKPQRNQQIQLLERHQPTFSIINAGLLTPL